MKYVNLGRAGLKMSPVILGCGNFGGVGSLPALFGKGESEDEAFALMDIAYDIGVNVFDTANSYGGGASEAMIGRWLARKDEPVRSNVVIVTKVCNPVGDGPNDRGLSRRHISRQIDASLSRLGVDAIDIYLAHEADPGTPWEETLSVFDDLIHRGKICYIGASNISAAEARLALDISQQYGLARFEVIENSYNLLDRDDDDEMLPLVRERSLGYMPFGPLAGGFLAGIYRAGESYPANSRMTLRPEPYRRFERDETWARLVTLKELASDRGVSMAAMALAWLIHHPLVTAPIVGPSRPEHFLPVQEALELELTPDEHQRLADLFAPEPEGA